MTMMRRLLLGLSLTVLLGGVLAFLTGAVAVVETHGNSMAPRIMARDLVVVRAANSYGVGDVVAYTSADLHQVVLHRVVAIDGQRYTFRGDHNAFDDPEQPRRDTTHAHPQGTGQGRARLRDRGYQHVRPADGSARAGLSRRQRHRLDQEGVHVIGDSITAGVHTTVLTESNRPKGWTVDGFPGRRVTALNKPYIRATEEYWPSVRHIYRPDVEQRVSTVVLAFGTNGAGYDMTMYQSAKLYAEGIRQIRSRDIWDKHRPKRIVLITPFRDPAIQEGAVSPSGEPYFPYQWAEKATVYGQAINHVAAHTDFVCVMDWRAYVETRYQWVLHDGTHPTAYGKRVWARMLKRTIRNCGR
jgi:lysophospholipase L1-like esterase